MLDNVIIQGVNTYYPFGLVGAGLTVAATVFGYSNSYYFSPVANRSFLVKAFERCGIDTNSKVNTALFFGSHTFLALSTAKIVDTFFNTHKVIKVAKDLGK